MSRTEVLVESPACTCTEPIETIKNIEIEVGNPTLEIINLEVSDSTKTMLEKLAQKNKIKITVVGINAAMIPVLAIKQYDTKDGIIIYNIKDVSSFINTYVFYISESETKSAPAISDAYFSELFNRTPTSYAYHRDDFDYYIAHMIKNEIGIIFDLLSVNARVNDFIKKEMLINILKNYFNEEKNKTLHERKKYDRRILGAYMDFVHNIVSNSKRLVRRKMEDLAEEIRGHYRAVQSLEKQMVDCDVLSKALSRRMRKNAIDTSETCVDKMLEPLFSHKKYVNFSFGDSYIKAHTTPIIIKHKNHDYLIGEFDVTVNLDGIVTMVNTTNRKAEYDHPHVNDRFPCLGNIKETVQDMIKNFNFLPLFDLLYDYLLSYTNANGYRPFSSISRWCSPEAPWCTHCDTLLAECACDRTRCRLCEHLTAECSCERCPATHVLLEDTDCAACEHWNADDEECNH